MMRPEWMKDFFVRVVEAVMYRVGRSNGIWEVNGQVNGPNLLIGPKEEQSNLMRHPLSRSERIIDRGPK